MRTKELLLRYGRDFPPAPHRKVPEHDCRAEEHLARAEEEGIPDDVPSLHGKTAEIRCHAEHPDCHGNEGCAEDDDDPVALPGVEDPPPSLRQGVVPPFSGILVCHQVRTGEDGEVLVNGRLCKTETFGELAHRHGSGIEQFKDGDPGVGGESGDVVPVKRNFFHALEPLPSRAWP